MSDEESHEGSLGLQELFPEAERPPTPEPKFSEYLREHNAQEPDWTSITVRLVGSHPLWAHYLWNSSRALATFLDDPQNRSLYRNLDVLELGAGAALPSVVVAKNGAKRVVATDFPDKQLLDNIQHNMDHNLSDAARSHVEVQGYIWGRSTAALIREASKFSLIILSDLIFNHSQHDALLNTCESCLAKETTHKPCVLVFYTHHRPHLADRDINFFKKAAEQGWLCEEILVRKFPPMFPEDPGDEEIRSTVHGWKLTRARP